MNETDFRIAVDNAWSGTPPSVDVWESLDAAQRQTLVDCFEANNITLPIDWHVKVERICVLCRHWQFDGGSPGYGPETPGDLAETKCTKGHWSLNLYYVDNDEYATKLLTARTCGDFALSRVALVNMPEIK